jgi:hypothetical protein
VFDFCGVNLMGLKERLAMSEKIEQVHDEIHKIFTEALSNEVSPAECLMASSFIFLQMIMAMQKTEETRLSQLEQFNKFAIEVIKDEKGLT